MASTSMLRMRNANLASASSTWWATSVCVEVLLGAKTKSWMRQPHSGSICRSPSAVPMTMRTDSSMLLSYLLSWMPPFEPTVNGMLKPTPRKLLMLFPMSSQRLCGGDTDFDDPLAGRTGDDGPALPFLDLQAFRSVALGADQSGGAAGVHCLDDLVPDGLE